MQPALLNCPIIFGQDSWSPPAFFHIVSAILPSVLSEEIGNNESRNGSNCLRSAGTYPGRNHFPATQEQEEAGRRVLIPDQSPLPHDRFPSPLTRLRNKPIRAMR